MLSLIEVQCPHCGAQGQIMVPPVGSIIIGPCPQCEELVVVFCGQVLPLEKATMMNGSLEERQDHLLGVLTEFLHDRVKALMTEDMVLEDATISSSEEVADEDSEETAEPQAHGKKDISESEFAKFIEVDLKKLDDKSYFESIFEK